jgi:Arc/MetJ family transcription regulator
MRLTTIPVSTEVRDRLKRLATKGETYDALLRRMVTEVEMRMLHDREKRILETEEFVPLDRT